MGSNDLSNLSKKRAAPELLLNQLRLQFGSRFSDSLPMREQHGMDESRYLPQPPCAVVFAHSTEEVAQLVVLCGLHNTPIIAFGTGSSIEGHLLAVEGGICVDLSQMNEVLSLDTEDLTATVQAGVTRDSLNTALVHSGFFFSVDPGANASLGGMAATAASGTNTVRYGTMRDNVLSLTVVTAEGKIIRTSRRAKKSSAGYCLTQLYIGSEGTLGIITEITVKLHPQPEAIAAAVVSFPDLTKAVKTVIQAVQMGIPMARAEMLDALAIKAINAHSHTTLKEVPTLFLEFSGSPVQIEEQSAVVRSLVEDNEGGDFEWATRPEDRNRIWSPRHHAYFACLQLRPGCRSLTTDACVPISRLAECLEQTLEDIQRVGLLTPVFGHVGDGNFHCLILVDPNNKEEISRAEGLSHRLIERAISFEGTCTGEHGVGLHKINYLLQEHGAETLDIMRRVKVALDPRNILNPGKVIQFAGTT
jgi:D-lactate dehydrogenase (cytochrome)